MNIRSILARLAALFTAVTLPLALTSCGGDTHEKLADDTISIMNKMGDAIAGVKDKASAEAAKTKIEGLVKEMKALKERGDKIGEATGDQKTKLEEKIQKAAQDVQTKMMGAMTQLQSAGPEAAAIIQSAMSGLSELK